MLQVDIIKQFNNEKNADEGAKLIKQIVMACNSYFPTHRAEWIAFIIEVQQSPNKIFELNTYYFLNAVLSAAAEYAYENCPNADHIDFYLAVIESGRHLPVMITERFPKALIVISYLCLAYRQLITLFQQRNQSLDMLRIAIAYQVFLQTLNPVVWFGRINMFKTLMSAYISCMEKLSIDPELLAKATKRIEALLETSGNVTQLGDFILSDELELIRLDLSHKMTQYHIANFRQHVQCANRHSVMHKDYFAEWTTAFASLSASIDNCATFYAHRFKKPQSDSTNPVVQKNLKSLQK
jgi:hypothetical protein